MGLPTQPVTLTPEQVATINRRLSELRHSANNHVALVMAAVELIRRRPDMAASVADSLANQPRKLADEIRAFSAAILADLGVTPDAEG